MLTSKEFARNYAHFLTNVTRAANDPEMPSFRELMKKVLGPISHVYVMEEILKWMPCSRRADGTIYKSSIDIARERGLSKRTVDRAVKKLETIGFERTIKKAKGAPTAHYSLNLTIFVRAIAKVLDIHWLYVSQWMENASSANDSQIGNIGDGVTEDQNGSTSQSDNINDAAESTSIVQQSQHDNRLSGEIDVAKKPTSFTTDTTRDNSYKTPRSGYKTTPMPTHHPVLPPWEVESIQFSLGTSTSNILTWVQKYGPDRVREVVKAAKDDARVQNKGAWVRRALEKGYEFKAKTADNTDTYGEAT